MQDQSQNGSSSPGRYDDSTYMIGSVAVGVIMPESSGSIENWTATELDQVTNEIQTGLADYVTWSNTTNSDTNLDGVSANVSFAYDFRRSIPTTYEPIQGTSDVCPWVSQVLNNMGFSNPEGCWEQVFDYIAYLRNTNGTDWATVVFVVDSSANVNGTFTDGYFGFTYGFATVMTYDNDGWGIDRMDQVTKHETAHVFGAADNYSDPGYGGCFSNTELAGYLGIPNSNCAVISGTTPNPSHDSNVLMTGGNPNRMHWTSQYQIGWRDSDDDHIADEMDTMPSYKSLSMNGGNVVGVVYDVPYHTTYYSNDVTLNTIVSARYHVDAGGWQTLSAFDGSFDTDWEEVRINPGSLTGGGHLNRGGDQQPGKHIHHNGIIDSSGE